MNPVLHPTAPRFTEEVICTCSQALKTNKYIMWEDGRAFWLLNLVVHEVHKKGRKLRSHRSLFIFVLLIILNTNIYIFQRGYYFIRNTTIYSEDTIYIRHYKETRKS
jgi:hypothetical protein